MPWGATQDVGWVVFWSENWVYAPVLLAIGGTLGWSAGNTIIRLWRKG